MQKTGGSSYIHDIRNAGTDAYFPLHHSSTRSSLWRMRKQCVPGSPLPREPGYEATLTLNRACSSWAWLIFITCCGNRILYAESSKLGKITSEILNDMQLILRSYKYLNICNPPLKMNGKPIWCTEVVHHLWGQPTEK